MSTRPSAAFFCYLATICAVLNCLAACGGRADSKKNGQQSPSGAVAIVQRGNLSHVLSLAGQFQPYQVVEVHAKVSGYLRHIYVDIGDRVHAGPPLATLDVPALTAPYR